jgi:hypothetical protein
MQRDEEPIVAFRRRLLRLIDDQFEGRYTVLAQRAGIPISTMQHYVHSAKHLPGGEHLVRLAAALGMTVQALLSDPEGVRPAERPAPLTPVVFTPRPTPPVAPAPHLSFPVFHCGCPDACPLTAAVPPLAAAHARVVLAAARVVRRRYHRLVGLEVGPGLPCADWPAGAHLVLDWDDRRPRWRALQLLHDAGRCRLGHVTASGDRLLFAARPDAAPVLVSPTGRVLGTIVAGVTTL